MSKSFRLDEWMDSLDESLLDNIPVEEMTMTEQEILQLQKNTMKKLKRRPPIGKKKIALLVAAAAALSAATMVTAGSLGSGTLFSRYFGGEDLQKGWLAKMCAEPVASCTAGGYQVDMLGVMGDRKSFNMIFDLTCPESESVSDTAHFETSRLMIDGKASGYSMGWTVIQLEDDDPTDNKARFMLSADADKKLVGKEITLRLETLQESSITPLSGEYEESIISDAAWSLTFPLDFEDLTRTIRINEKAVWKEEIVKIKSIELSPVALRVNLALPVQKALSSLFGGSSGTIAVPAGDPFSSKADANPDDDYAITFQMKDGTVVEQGDLSMMCGESRNMDGWIVSWNFCQLIDVSEVASVTVMGQEIGLR